MALLDTTPAAPSMPSGVRVALGADGSRLDPYERDGLGRRSLPFLVAVVVAIAVIPVTPASERDGSQILAAVGALACIFAAGFALSRMPFVPRLVGKLLPYAYLLAVVVLREGTGGITSGYGVLLYLAPFWVALYDSRTQVLAVTVAVFALQSGFAWPDGGDAESVRRALLGATVIGLMSLAVHRKVSALRSATLRIEEESDARSRAYEQLAHGAEALERSNRELEQFAYVSSHDIQEPLRMIRSFSQLFVQRHGHQLDDEGHELLGFVVDGAERAQRLVNDLLQYSLIGRSERELAPVELGAALDRATETLAPQVADAGARVQRTGTFPAVLGDAPQLESLFVNLVGNAIKYRDAERPCEVRVDGSRVGDHVEVTVGDNGIGFAPEHRERIFLMFQRLHGRTSYEGTGIGLAICARIVDRHGGTIAADGRPGEGATIRFTLPTAPTERAT